MRTWQRWLGLAISLNLAGWLSAEVVSNNLTRERENAEDLSIVAFGFDDPASASDGLIMAAGISLQILIQPLNQVAKLGDNVSFDVAALGAEPLYYQWRFNGASLPGETNYALQLNGITTNQAGSYSVVVSNLAGSVTSAVARLSIIASPSILVAPQSQAVVQGAQAMFIVGATGGEPFSYQWELNGLPIPGANSLTLIITNVQDANAGSYRVVVSNVVGAAWSDPATLTVLHLPSIDELQTDPLPLYAPSTWPIGQTITLSATATGDPPLVYQWSRNDEPIAEATNAFYVFNLETTNAGVYRVTVTNRVGSALSQPISVNLPAGPQITTQPKSQVLFVGSPVFFNVAATGTSPLSYQWFFNGVEFPFATNPGFGLASAPIFAGGDYSAVVANDFGSATSEIATLTVIVPILSASHAGSSYRSPGTTTIACQLDYAKEVSLISLVCRPVLPAGWTLVSANGPGQPQVVNDTVVFAGPFTDNPLTFSYTVNVPANQGGTNEVQSIMEYRFAGLLNPATQTALPDRLSLTGETLARWTAIFTDAQGVCHLELAGTAGRGYILETTSEFTGWLTLATNNANSAGRVAWVDPGATDQPHRFYRAHEQP